MRFATSDRVFTEDIPPTDLEGIRRVLHKILDEQIDKYSNILRVDLKQPDRIATVDIRTFKHEGDAASPIVVKAHEGALVQGVSSKIVTAKRDRRLTS